MNPAPLTADCSMTPSRESLASAPCSFSFLSVCSGIEAASVAWEPLGGKAVAFAEIEKFPSAVLAHHWPDVPNLGDMTKHNDWPASLRPDLIVGGTPCQAFSVAGLRQGLADPRGNLTLVFLGLLEQFRPRWVVWENVPGVLSDKTGAFGAFLGGLGQLGYGFAYRILDAQHFGVPQRRRRVFVVANLGSWQRAGAVLFEPESLRGDHPPRREAGQRVAPTLDVRAGRSGETTFHTSGGLVDVAPTLSARTKGGGGMGTDFDCDEGLIPVPFNLRGREGGAMPEVDPDGLACQRAASGGSSRSYLAFAENSRGELRLEGGDGQRTGALSTGGGKPGQGSPCVAFAHQAGGIQTTLGYDPETGTAPTLAKCQTPAIHHGPAVRRLTPRECERLQGFPDDHTLVPWRGKMASDGPRYKALGNSMAVPVMRWIGERISQMNATGDATSPRPVGETPPRNSDAD